MNLTDYETTPIHVAYEECCKDAKVLRNVMSHDVCALVM